MKLKDYIGIFEDYTINTAGYEKTDEFYYEFTDSAKRRMTMMFIIPSSIIKINIFDSPHNSDEFLSFRINNENIDDIITITENILNFDTKSGHKTETFYDRIPKRTIALSRLNKDDGRIDKCGIVIHSGSEIMGIAISEDELQLFYELLVEFKETGKFSKKDI